jgi:hypothetical protein
MRIVFSKEWREPVFGLATKGRFYDKLVHFALSAAAVMLAALVLELCLPTVLAVLFAGIGAFTFGFGVEVKRGYEAANAERDGCILAGKGRGFSWLCLAADAAGVALAWLFFWRL